MMKKKLIGLLLLAVLIGVAVYGVVQANIEKNNAIPADDIGNIVEMQGGGVQGGEPAPDFELQTLSGDTVRLSDYQGQKVILNFWASWCAPCRKEMPHMQNYYEEQAEAQNVEILAVNLTSSDNGMEKIRSFADDFGLTFPIPLDAKGELGETYQAITIPTTYMIDTEGIIRHKIVGPMDEEMMTDLAAELE